MNFNDSSRLKKMEVYFRYACMHLEQKLLLLAFFVFVCF